jgi:DNA-3-methyladenine glycosylase I
MTRAALMKLAQTEASMRLSKELKRRGWRFVGPTTCYAFMQAMGLVNDHLETCVVREIAEKERAAFRRPSSSSLTLPSMGRAEEG